MDPQAQRTGNSCSVSLLPYNPFPNRTDDISPLPRECVSVSTTCLEPQRPAATSCRNVLRHQDDYGPLDVSCSVATASQPSRHGVRRRVRRRTSASLEKEEGGAKFLVSPQATIVALEYSLGAHCRKPPHRRQKAPQATSRRAQRSSDRIVVTRPIHPQECHTSQTVVTDHSAARERAWWAAFPSQGGFLFPAVQERDSMSAPLPPHDFLDKLSEHQHGGIVPPPHDLLDERRRTQHFLPPPSPRSHDVPTPYDDVWHPVMDRPVPPAGPAFLRPPSPVSLPPLHMLPSPHTSSLSLPSIHTLGLLRPDLPRHSSRPSVSEDVLPLELPRPPEERAAKPARERRKTRSVKQPARPSPPHTREEAAARTGFHDGSPDAPSTSRLAGDPAETEIFRPHPSRRMQFVLGGEPIQHTADPPKFNPKYAYQPLG